MRLIDGNKVAEAITWLEILDFALWHVVQKCIDKLPTVDAVPVVRCKDCKECEVRRTANYLPFFLLQIK